MPLKTIPLTSWRIMPDPEDWGEQDGWYRADHTARDWHAVSAPFSLNEHEKPGLAAYGGVLWCRCDVPGEHEPLGRRWLACDSLHHQPRIWIDGTEINHDLLPFLPSRVPLPDGARTVVIRLEGQPGAPHLGHPERGWRHDVGILGVASLLTTGPAWIEQFALDAVRTADGGRLTGSIHCGGELKQGDELIVYVGDREFRFDACETDINLQLPGVPAWSPDQPLLVSCSITLQRKGQALDREELRLGFRTVTIAEGRLCINGEPFTPVGFNYHRDTHGAGMADDPAATRRDLEAMREYGATFVRLCHYPHPRHTLACCDELGLLALAEIPFTFWEGSDDAESVAGIANTARRHLDGLITTQRHHPSILCWSVGNENHENRPEVQQVLAGLIARAKELDSSRPATHVSNHFGRWPFFEHDDIICINHYPSWGIHLTAGHPPADNETARDDRVRESWETSIAELKRQHPGKPILVTEFGFPGIAGVVGGPIGEERQARQTLFEAGCLGGIAGASIWVWADHVWPPAVPTRHRLGKLTIAPFGVLDRERNPKRVSRHLDSIFKTLHQQVEA